MNSNKTSSQHNNQTFTLLLHSHPIIENPQNLSHTHKDDQTKRIRNAAVKQTNKQNDLKSD